MDQTVNSKVLFSKRQLLKHIFCAPQQTFIRLNKEAQQSQQCLMFSIQCPMFNVHWLTSIHCNIHLILNNIIAIIIITHRYIESHEKNEMKYP